MLAWNFYQRNARAFVRLYGLMPSRITSLGLTGASLDIFIDKLCEIHVAIQERFEARALAESQKDPNALIGEDNV